jgi:hypothetical protein
VRHLHAVHRVLVALRAREVDVEHEVRVAAAHQVEVPHRVAPRPVDEVAHRDVAAGALGDLHLLAAAHHGDHLVQHVLGVALGDAEARGLEPRAHARRGAVVVAPLHVDGAPVAALPLRHVVGHVRDEVGVLAALRGAPAHHAVLVVAVRRGAQEERAVLLVGRARVDERAHRAVDPAVGVERALEVVRVERHAEGAQVEVLLGPQRRDRVGPHRLEQLGVAGAAPGGDRLGAGAEHVASTAGSPATSRARTKSSAISAM